MQHQSVAGEAPPIRIRVLKPLKARTCKSCGEAFRSRSRRWYCTPTCQARMRAASAAKVREANPDLPHAGRHWHLGIIRNCASCGTTFQSRQRIYCAKACRKQAGRQRHADAEEAQAHALVAFRRSLGISDDGSIPALTLPQRCP